MKSGIRLTRLWAFFATLAFILSFSGPALAVDDGARAYWKGRDGTNVVSFQYLNLNMQASDTQQFDPAHFIYPNADAEANIMIANYARHFTLFNRASLFAVNLVGGSVDLDVNTNRVPSGFLPPGVMPGDSFRQSASGFADPSVQFDVNIFGTSQLKSTVDLVNYEPTLTLDAAVLLAFPIGQYDKDKLVNMGLNRWYGRFALPMKYHFGAFAPGYRSSFELTPSVWLFAENDDFVGQKLENDPLWQIEAHLTHDFTRSFFGSLAHRQSVQRIGGFGHHRGIVAWTDHYFPDNQCNRQQSAKNGKVARRKSFALSRTHVCLQEKRLVSKSLGIIVENAAFRKIFCRFGLIHDAMVYNHDPALQGCHRKTMRS